MNKGVNFDEKSQSRLKALKVLTSLISSRKWAKFSGLKMANSGTNMFRILKKMFKIKKQFWELYIPSQKIFQQSVMSKHFCLYFNLYSF